MIPGSVPSFKRHHRKLIKWYERQLELLDVDIADGKSCYERECDGICSR